MTDTQRHHHAPGRGSGESLQKKVFCRVTSGERQGLALKAGCKGTTRSLLLSAHSLHWSWDSPQFWTHRSLLSPRAPYLPPQGSTGGLGAARPSSQTRQPPPARAWRAQCNPPWAGKPLCTRGNSEAPRTRVFYTSSMTVPLPLTLPTGCDFNHRFPP